MMNRKHKTILSIAYGVTLSGLATLVMAETFLFSSASGKTGDISQHLFDFDSTALVSDPETESISVPMKETMVSYQEYTYNVEEKTIPYMIVTVNLKKISDLRTRIAVDDTSSYGVNITESFSDLISESETDSGKDVLFAIDGDYPFWSGREGYVIRNGLEYRREKRDSSSDLDLAIFKDGSFKAFDEKDYSFDTLMDMNDGCYQNWSFGPALLADNEIKVSETQDVSQKMSANQRTGMGYKEDGTLYFLCSNTNDGKRKSSSVGLSLYQMAGIFSDLGCFLAYNLDGGGSANMYIKGYQDDGYYMKQTRALGDIIYVVNA